jgi:hypothetical protein
MVWREQAYIFGEYDWLARPTETDNRQNYDVYHGYDTKSLLEQRIGRLRLTLHRKMSPW